MVDTYIKKIMHNMIFVTLVCIKGRPVTCFWLVKRLGWLKTLTVGFPQIPYYICNKCQTLHDGANY